MQTSTLIAIAWPASVALGWGIGWLMGHHHALTYSLGKINTVLTTVAKTTSDAVANAAQSVANKASGK